MISIKQINNFKLQIKRSVPEIDHQGLTPNIVDFSSDDSPHPYEEAHWTHVDSTTLDKYYLEVRNTAQSHAEHMNFNVQIATDTLTSDFIRNRSLPPAAYQVEDSLQNEARERYSQSNNQASYAANESSKVFNSHSIYKRSNSQLKLTCDEAGEGVDRRDARLGIWSSKGDIVDENNDMENTIERISTIDKVEHGAINGERDGQNTKIRRSLLENRNVLSLKSSSTHILKQKTPSQNKDKSKITDLNQKSSIPAKTKIVNIKEDDLKKNWTSTEETNVTEETTTQSTTTVSTTTEIRSTHDPKVKLIDLKHKVKEITKLVKPKGDKLDKTSGEKKGKDKKVKQKEKSTERNETTTKKKPKSKEGKVKENTGGSKKQQKENKSKKPKEGGKGKAKGNDKDKIKFLERHEERLIESKKNKTGKSKEVKLKTWDECTSEGDYLIFYDGPTQQDPVLFKYCGNGE